MTRVIASLVILAILSPALATITCDVVCEMTSHDEMATMTAACHEHMAHHDAGASIKGMPSGPCHDGDTSPAAVLSDSLQLVAVPAAAPASPDAAPLDLLRLTRATSASSGSSGSPPLTSQLRI